jgi:antitoxin HigA-1
VVNFFRRYIGCQRSPARAMVRERYIYFTAGVNGRWATIRRERIMARKLKPIHPGEQLREEFMKPYGLSMNKLAMDLPVPVTRIAKIVKERRGITADTAFRLARYFQTTPQFWMNVQKHYELEVATDEIAEKIERDVRPFEPASTR